MSSAEIETISAKRLCLRQLPDRLSAADLMALDLPAVPWALAGIIPEGLTILAGKPKAGKSWFSLGLAVGIAAGGEYMAGQLVLGDVLYLTLEDNHRRLQRRLRKVLAGRPAPERLEFALSWPRLPDGVSPIIEWVEHAADPRLIIVDTLAKVRHPNRAGGYDYADDYRALAELKEVADHHGVSAVPLQRPRA